MPELVRFGPFELDLEAAELQTDGRKSRLPEQQFQILHMLLVQEGGVVSREEIRKRLWPNDTVVEFDRSINAAIMKLRIALGDTGDKPRFIETLVRRGYRLIVPVEWDRSKPISSGSPEMRQNSLVGQKVSHYRVLGILGGGGMGLVYKGEDLKLNRAVALKFIPGEMATDPLTVQRFEREARTASSLNHPNICTIYEVEEHESQPFIVMELLEGETLRELISRFAALAPRGGQVVPLAQLLEIASQIGEGLNAAHQKGIIHRDIKPANIFVSPSGKVKILDFGLAKPSIPSAPELAAGSDGQDMPTGIGSQNANDLTLSHAGATLGTAGYMSPEQVLGERLDARTDLFSFGLVLYEMATGSHPFVGRTAIELSAAILRDAPAPIPLTVPPGLRAVIARCLEKSRERRYQSAGEALSALEAIRGPDDGLFPKPAAERFALPRWAWFGLPVLLALILVVFNWHRLTDRLSPGGSRSVATSSAPAVKPRRSLAVLSFQNSSKRPDEVWLSTALSGMLATELAAGDQLRIVPAENVARMEHDLSLPEMSSLAGDTLRRVHSYLGSDLILVGGYTALGQASGGQVRLDVELQDAATGDTVASVAEAGSEINLFDLVSRVGSDLRQRLGVGELLQADAAEVHASYPATPEAARLYAEGLARLRVFNARDALDLLQKAVALDEKFPLAHYALAQAWLYLGYDEKAKDEAKTAFELSGSLSREERLLVEGRYREITRSWPVAIDVYRTLAGFYPDNSEYGLKLSGAQINGGKAKDALSTLAALKSLPPPQNQDPRISLQLAQAKRKTGDPNGMLAAAETAVSQAQSQGAKFVEANAWLAEGTAHLELGDKDKALAAWEQSRSIWASANYPGEVAKILNNTGIIYHQRGDLPEADRRWEQALSIWRNTGNKAGQLNVLANLANLHSDEGDLAGAKQMDLEVLSIAHELGGTDAETLLDLSDREIGLGDLEAATARAREALDLGRQSDNQSEVAAALAHLGLASYFHGDLQGGKKSLQEAMEITQKTGDKSHGAEALANWAEILMAGGNLPEARKNLQDALKIRSDISETSNAFATRLQLAQLSIEEGNAADAERAAREVRDEFHKEGHADDELGAEIVLLRAMIAQKKLNEAEQELGGTKALLAKSQDISNRLEMAIVEAQIDADAGKTEPALQGLSAVLRDATKYGFVPDQFEARFAHAEVELTSGKRDVGEAELRALRKEATAKGFGLLATKSAAALSKKQSKL